MQNQLESKAYAGFFVRLVAYGIDMLIASIVVGMVKIPFSIAASGGADFLKSNFIFEYSFLDVLGYVGVAAYFVLLTYFAHTTIGKMLLHLEVISEKKWTFVNVLYRETVGRFLSSLLNIGYLAVIVQKEKQGFHDMLCDTHVVYKNMFEKKSKTASPSVITYEEMVNSAKTASPGEAQSSSGIVEESSFAQTDEHGRQEETDVMQKDQAALSKGDQALESAVLMDIEPKQALEQQIMEAAMDEEKEQTWTYYQQKQEPKPDVPSAFELTESNPVEARPENIE